MAEMIGAGSMTYGPEAIAIEQGRRSPGAEAFGRCGVQVLEELERASEICRQNRVTWGVVGRGMAPEWVSKYDSDAVSEMMLSVVRGCEGFDDAEWLLDCSELPCIVLMDKNPALLLGCPDASEIWWTGHAANVDVVLYGAAFGRVVERDDELLRTRLDERMRLLGQSFKIRP